MIAVMKIASTAVSLAMVLGVTANPIVQPGAVAGVEGQSIQRSNQHPAGTHGYHGCHGRNAEAVAQPVVLAEAHTQNADLSSRNIVGHSYHVGQVCDAEAVTKIVARADAENRQLPEGIETLKWDFTHRPTHKENARGTSATRTHEVSEITSIPCTQVISISSGNAYAPPQYTSVTYLQPPKGPSVFASTKVSTSSVPDNSGISGSLSSALISSAHTSYTLTSSSIAYSSSRSSASFNNGASEGSAPAYSSALVTSSAPSKTSAVVSNGTTPVSSNGGTSVTPPAYFPPTYSHHSYLQTLSSSSKVVFAGASSSVTSNGAAPSASAATHQSSKKLTSQSLSKSGNVYFTTSTTTVTSNSGFSVLSVASSKGGTSEISTISVSSNLGASATSPKGPSIVFSSTATQFETTSTIIETVFATSRGTSIPSSGRVVFTQVPSPSSNVPSSSSNIAASSSSVAVTTSVETPVVPVQSLTVVSRGSKVSYATTDSSSTSSTIASSPSATENSVFIPSSSSPARETDKYFSTTGTHTTTVTPVVSETSDITLQTQVTISSATNVVGVTPGPSSSNTLPLSYPPASNTLSSGTKSTIAPPLTFLVPVHAESSMEESSESSIARSMTTDTLYNTHTITRTLSLKAGKTNYPAELIIPSKASVSDTKASQNCHSVVTVTFYETLSPFTTTVNDGPSTSISALPSGKSPNQAHTESNPTLASPERTNTADATPPPMGFIGASFCGTHTLPISIVNGTTQHTTITGSSCPFVAITVNSQQYTTLATPDALVVTTPGLLATSASAHKSATIPEGTINPIFTANPSSSYNCTLSFPTHYPEASSIPSYMSSSGAANLGVGLELALLVGFVGLVVLL